MAVLQAAWLRPAALGLAALVFALWCVRYFRAMAWKRGTLEWIARFDRRRMTAAEAQRPTGPGWALTAAAAVLGAGAFLLRQGAVRDLPGAGLCALGAAAVYLMLLLLGGAPVSALLGAGLWLAAGGSAPVLPGAVGLAALSLLLPGFLGLIPASAGLALAAWGLGCGAATAALVLGTFVLYLVSMGLQRPDSVFDGASRTLLLLMLCCAALAGAALWADPGLREPAALAAALPGLLKPEVSLTRPALPLWLGLAGAAVLLTEAVRLREGRWLLGGLLALLCAALSLLGLGEAAALGCALALGGTFAGADGRGGRAASIAAALLLGLMMWIV